MPVALNCRNCGKGFSMPPANVRRGQGIYCSVACRSAHQKATGQRRLAKPRKACLQCGGFFEVRLTRQDRTKYCSVTCRQEAKRMAAQAVSRPPCLVCGQPIKAGATKYCGMACRSLATTGEGNHGWRGGLIERRLCDECGEEFDAYKPDVERGMGRFCGRRCYHKWRSGHMAAEITYTSGKGGRREDLGGLYVRSIWEANWARYLNWLMEHGQIAGWVYEPDTFEFPVKRGSRFYTPDFKVTENDGSIIYHEVKGYLDQVSATKLRRMKTHYPKVKLRVIDRDVYTAVARQVGAMIPNWEKGKKPF